MNSGIQDFTVLITEKERVDITHLGELVFKVKIGVIPNKNFHINEYNDLYDLNISVLRSLKINKRFSNDHKLKKEL